jgi:hypothetical protein
MHRDSEQHKTNVLKDIIASGWMTVIGWVLFVGCTYGVYTTNQKWNEERLSQMEAAIVRDDTRINQQEDHERRITKLETRADDADTKFAELSGKLDTTIAILNRVEASVTHNQHSGESK